MYPALRKEMKERKVRGKDIARLLGFAEMSVSNKMTGVTPWRLNEAFMVRDEFFPDLTVDYLFQTVDLK